MISLESRGLGIGFVQTLQIGGAGCKNTIGVESVGVVLVGTKYSVGIKGMMPYKSWNGVWPVLILKAVR